MAKINIKPLLKKKKLQLGFNKTWQLSPRCIFLPQKMISRMLKITLFEVG